MFYCVAVNFILAYWPKIILSVIIKACFNRECVMRKLLVWLGIGVLVYLYLESQTPEGELNPLLSIAFMLFLFWGLTRKL